MLLLYCMTQDDAPSACAGLQGVSGSEVRDVAKNGVRYFYSGWKGVGTADEVKQQALAFHRVNQEIFEHTTVIPFRFPTHVADQTDLEKLIDSTSSEYSTELVRLHGSVQLKVKVTAPAAGTPVAPATSGTEYLKQRQRAAAPVSEAVKKILNAVSPIVSDTSMATRDGSATLHLLLQRDRQEELKHALSLLTELPATVTVSGPWPPSEFVNCYPEQRSEEV